MKREEAGGGQGRARGCGRRDGGPGRRPGAGDVQVGRRGQGQVWAEQEDDRWPAGGKER